PAGRVAVAPFAAHRRRKARDAALREPAREELLRASVAAGHVEVAQACGPCDVEQLRRACVERLGRAPRRQVPASSEGDVARSSDRGEAEPETRDRETRRPEWPDR